MKTINFETRVRVTNKIERVLVNFKRTGDYSDLENVQNEAKNTYLKELTNKGLNKRYAESVANHILQEDIQNLADRVQY